MTILCSAGCSNSFKLLEYLDGTAANVDPSEEDEILALSPENPTLKIDTAITFTTTGGTQPYQYFVEIGPGIIEIDSGEYSPTGLGNATIRAVDFAGMYVETTVYNVPIDAD